MEKIICEIQGWYKEIEVSWDSPVFLSGKITIPLPSSKKTFVLDAHIPADGMVIGVFLHYGKKKDGIPVFEYKDF